jgi:hypothetical protein
MCILFVRLVGLVGILSSPQGTGHIQLYCAARSAGGVEPLPLGISARKTDIKRVLCFICVGYMGQGEKCLLIT